MNVSAEGHRIRPLHFNADRGRKIIGIIHPKTGRVFRPNPYNIPWQPYKILAFAMHLILALMDRRMITDDDLGGKESWHKYRTLTTELLASVEIKHIQKKDPSLAINYQPN